MNLRNYLLVAALAGFSLTSCNSEKPDCNLATNYEFSQMTDSLKANLKWPDNLDIQVFTDDKLVPSPSCLAASASGDVFVGVDKIGSLGKEIGQGAIVKLTDCNGDGILDSHSLFAEVDNPRGILALGNQVFVLHTRFSPETKKAENMDLVVFTDEDNDGVADGAPKTLIKNISNPTYLAERGTDHATNGIQIGIDGWIYIAVGDFGFHYATDVAGNKLTMLGGGIVRVRPDGTEMEVYTTGLRNIYDVAIDPFMNIYTRDNTNDGGGWNIRFSHQIQSGEYGYPLLFQNYTEEIIPALVDAGGGSGTGSLYLNDQRWPAEYNNTPLMADWGRSYLYRHSVTADGPTYTQKDEEFIQLPQITDLDIDGTGILYLSAWDGAGYSGSPDKGYVIRAVPKDFKFEYLGKIESKSTGKLIDLLKSPHAKVRQAAQYELISRGDTKKVESASLKLANNTSLPTETRVAALYTYAQVTGEKAIEKLVELTNDTDLQEHALRALADRKNIVNKVPAEPFITGLKSNNPRVQSAAIIGLGRLGKKETVKELLNVKVPASFKAPALGKEGPHATPNSEIVLPHLAVKAIVALNPIDELVQALDTDNKDIALWAARYLHNDKIVEKLIQIYPNADETLKRKVLNTLSRIYHKEADYDATWWWGTRPDSHGPYYKTIDWSSTNTIKDFLLTEWKAADTKEKEYYKVLNTKYRLNIAPFGTVDLQSVSEEHTNVDLEKIKNKKGQVGESSIEDIMLALQKIKGDPEKGGALFQQQGCQVCHSISKDEAMKGPYMGQIGSIMNREQIIESILKPNASISQGFSTVQLKTKQGKTLVGFVTAESAEKITIRDISGKATDVNIKDLAERKEMDFSMMPTGLANALSFEELASLVAYLEKQK